jgi:protein-L-isoaspartate(D-aspartate) O-methyltransferase
MERGRQRMIESQLVRRGIGDARVLDAFRALPREAFVPERMGELAYEDSPLPIGSGQTISQPYVVALTLEALRLRGDERVLEIGTGSGYAAALLGLLAREVFTIERIEELAKTARERLENTGITNVTVVHADGSLGLPREAPFDAIAVAASGPRVPRALRMQLAIGGRLVMPVGEDGGQHLVRITRLSDDEWKEERLLAVSFVPLIGAEAWPEMDDVDRPPERDDRRVVSLVRRAAIPFDDGHGEEPPDLLDRIGDARVVILGGALDGSAELQHARARMTWQLVAHGGFSLVAIECDYLEAARIDEYVRSQHPRTSLPLTAFSRTGELRWRNAEVAALFDAFRALPSPPGIHGLDFFGTNAAVSVALERLAEHDEERAADVRAHFATISPWRRASGDLTVGIADPDFEADTIELLLSILDARVEATRAETRRVRDVVLRACESADAYYRLLLRGSLDAWSLRDDHMAAMLRALLTDRGSQSKVVVWASDPHVADADALRTGVRGHVTLGQRCRTTFGRDAYLVGMSAHHGKVLASPSWGAPPAPMDLRAAPTGSYEQLFHELGVPAFLLPLRGADPALRLALLSPRIARCIGPVYAPTREHATHWLEISVPAAFDAYLFVDHSSAVTPILPHAVAEPDAMHPLHS